jgi:hypothetical protein
MNKPTKEGVVAREDVRQRSEAAADSFKLVGDAMANLSGQGDIFGGAQDEPKADDASAKAKAKAQEDLDAALGDLGDIFGKNFRMNMMPEQEQKLLPVLTKVMDAAFRLGYYKFKDAAKFVLDTIRAKLGGDVAVESKAEIEAHQAKEGNEYVPNTNGGMERDSQKPATGPAMGNTVSDDAGTTSARTGESGGQTPGEGRSGQQYDTGLPTGGPVANGERSDQLLRGGREPTRPASSDARTDFGERSGDSGITGVPPDAISADQVKDAATDGTQDARSRSAQRAAGQLDVKAGDLQNVRDTLPYLLPEQQEDVHKAETIFARPTGYGMLFTNGTGTGKTFTGLGVVKRFAMQGKDNTLIMGLKISPCAPRARRMSRSLKSNSPLLLVVGCSFPSAVMVSGSGARASACGWPVPFSATRCRAAFPSSVIRVRRASTGLNPARYRASDCVRASNL